MTRPPRTAVAVDTSVAIPLLAASHRSHRTVVDWQDGRTVLLSGHALVEMYSVLTRLPGDARLAPVDASRLLSERFGPPLTLRPAMAKRMVSVLAAAEIVGGAVYDAMIGLAAREHGYVLATRDLRARSTYDALGVSTELAA